MASTPKEKRDATASDIEASDGPAQSRDGQPAQIEKAGDAQAQGSDPEPQPKAKPAFLALSLLDRFLAVWILLAMAIGIIVGNFASDVGPALQKGKFVGVSVPIGG